MGEWFNQFTVQVIRLQSESLQTQEREFVAWHNDFAFHRRSRLKSFSAYNQTEKIRKKKKKKKRNYIKINTKTESMNTSRYLD